MLLSGNQNQFASSLTSLGDLLKAIMFLSNLNGFNSSLSPQDQRFGKRVLPPMPKCGRKKAPSD